MKEQRIQEIVDELRDNADPDVHPDLYRDAADCIEFLRKTNWVKANDEMPDDDMVVMIFGTSKRNHGHGEPEVWIGYHDGCGWTAADGTDMIVSHWMELPEGPKA